MKMAAMNQDSATEDKAGGITRRIKDYCDQAVANLKAGRLKETYLYANEALELDKNDANAAALYRHALYTLLSKKRLLDKAKTLHEEAGRCMRARNYDKALELISLAKKWHCTPGILDKRALIYHVRSSFDLAYVDFTEGLAESKKDKVPFATGQVSSLSLLGYKVLPVIEHDPIPLRNEMPALYHVNNWPPGLRINDLNVYLLRGYAGNGYAKAMKTDGTMLKPDIPLCQLAQFLNHHAQGAMERLSFASKDRLQDMVPRLLDEVTVPGRLHVHHLSFFDFFLLPWTSIERILDGQTLRANMVDFNRLQLPSGVDTNELLKLPTLRDCIHLRVLPYSRFMPQLPGPVPLFNNAPLLEWIKRSDGRSLELTREYISSGLLSFLDALKTDFRQATKAHSYGVVIRCPHIDVKAGLGVRNERLCNRLGEKMEIGIGVDPAATFTMGHQFQTVVVRRLPPS